MQSKAILCAAILAATTLLRTSAAQATVYNVDIVHNADSVIGTLTTDGTLGVLTDADITDYDVTISIGAASVEIVPRAGHSPEVIGDSLVATSSTLSFNFGSSTLDSFDIGGAVNESAILAFNADGNPSDDVEIQIGQAEDLFAATSDIVGTTTPIPPSLLLFVSGLGVLGLIARRSKTRVSFR